MDSVHRNGAPAAPVGSLRRSLLSAAPIEDLVAGWRCVKRDGTTVAFDTGKIAAALGKCFESVPAGAVASAELVPRLIRKVLNGLYAASPLEDPRSPSVEDVQRLVIQQLWAEGLFDAAEHYTIYREERRKARERRPIPPEVARRIRADAAYFPTPLQYYQFLSKFSRWRDEDQRRETWQESNNRVFTWFATLPQYHLLTRAETDWLRFMMRTMKASPALRIVQMAGPALERCHFGCYNCAALPLIDLRCFAELLYGLMQGSGVGFSVESDFISQLPRVERQKKGARPHPWKIPDTTEGWCDALLFGLERWFAGEDVDYDYTGIRPAGAILKIKGGRASGYGPLKALLDFARKVVLGAQGRHLTDLEAHDIACMEGKIVQVGGVRRASCISLSDLDSVRMREAKHGNWWLHSGQRAMANNCLPAGTAVYTVRGCLPIEQVRPGDVVITAAGRGRVTAAVDSGVRETVLIQHGVGCLECTPDHRVAVFDSIDAWKFKKARDVCPGDALVFDHRGYDGQETQLPEVSYRATGLSTLHVTVPSLTPEIAWLVGLFQGDGNTSVSRQMNAAQHPSYGRVAIACSKELPQIVQRVRQALKQFGVRTQLREQTSKLGSCWIVRADSVELAMYFRAHLKQSRTSINVPSWILQGSRAVRAAYLAGLVDSDGSTRDTTVEIASSVYADFLSQVRMVAASIGIAAKLRLATDGRGVSQPVHKLTVHGVDNRRQLDQLVGGMSSRYQLASPPFPGRSVREFAYPTSVVAASGVCVSYMSGSRQSLDRLRRDLPELDPPGLPVTVRSVRPSGRSVRTYDLEVAGIHQFTADGLVVHNSAVYEEPPAVEVFMEEWLALVKSRSGERGIFNRGGAEANKPTRRKSSKWLVNPCVPADTWVMTAQGPRRVEDLQSAPFTAIVDGRPFQATPFVPTGTRSVFEVSLANGVRFRATAEHRVRVVTKMNQHVRLTAWRELEALVPGDRVVLHNHRSLSWDGTGTEEEGYLLGSLVGDGCFGARGQALLDFWGESRQTMREQVLGMIHGMGGTRSHCLGVEVADVRVGKVRIQSAVLGRLAQAYGIERQRLLTDAVEEASSAFSCGFLRGWFDSDGTVTGSQAKGLSVRLNSSCLEKLRRGQRMLARLGINSTLYENRHEAGYREMPDGKGGQALYPCQANHDLVIANDNLQEFASRIGFVQPDKADKLRALLAGYQRRPNRDRFAESVVSIVEVGTEPVYDCAVPGPEAFDANGCYVHNCGEVIFRPFGLCNLTICLVRGHETPDELREKVRAAAMFGVLQSCATSFQYVRSEWKTNAEDERLIGVDIMGHLDHPLLRPGAPGRTELVRSLKEEVAQVSVSLAQRFGINPSAANTVLKPGGDSSVLFDTTSLRPYESPYQIRRTRESIHSPVCKFLQEAGVPWEPAAEDEAGLVAFAWPKKNPDHCICRGDQTAIEQLENWLFWQTTWAEMSCAATISVKDHEWLEVGAWVYAHWDRISGLSFLPDDNGTYRTVPNETISKERYDELMAAFPVIDWAQLLRYEDGATEGAQTPACVGNSCAL